MLFLILAILTSACISVIMRLSGAKVKNTIGMLVVSYLTSTLLAGLHMGFSNLLPQNPQLPMAIGMSLINGFFYACGFVLMQMSIPKNGVVSTSTFMRLGLVVSILLSILLFREIPTTVQIVGLCLAIGAIILHSGTTGKINPMLFVILISSGTGDTWAKVFNTFCDTALSEQFLFGTFLSAALLCLILMLHKKQRITFWEVVFGASIAIPNYYNSRFLLRSLQQLPGIIVYPTFSVATLLLIAAIGVGAFREKLNRRQWIAMAVILVALALLNL